MIRPRMNTLLHDAIKRPLAIVCAQAGYGKTRAVYDFSRESTLACAWIQVSERDNLASRFWESLVRAIAQLDQSAADKLSDLGFPDTEEKMSRYLDIRERALNTKSDKRPLMVIDDFHLIENPDILAFLERFIHHTLEDRSLILIT
ncbi:MAG: helix-turn-helix transcriptional regulator, partial [Actinomycetia bacterium]|nr:helix-turn-helix transcriptional regulator [Actinomycetes bacterium]